MNPQNEAFQNFGHFVSEWRESPSWLQSNHGWNRPSVNAIFPEASLDWKQSRQSACQETKASIMQWKNLILDNIKNQPQKWVCWCKHQNDIPNCGPAMMDVLQRQSPIVNSLMCFVTADQSLSTRSCQVSCKETLLGTFSSGKMSGSLRWRDIPKATQMVCQIASRDSFSEFRVAQDKRRSSENPINGKTLHKGPVAHVVVM